LGQQLTAIELMCQALKSNLDAPAKVDELRSELDRVCRHVRDAIAQTRMLAHGLAAFKVESGGLEVALTELARAAGILYAYSVQLAFEDAEGQLKQLKSAADDMSRFLKTTKKIQRVLDLVSSVAGIAAAVISYDLNGVVSGIDEVVQILANP